jgi:hypothetical protein
VTAASQQSVLSADPVPSVAVVVEQPDGDPAQVSASGSRLVAQSDVLRQVQWRIAADAEAMRADRRWCSPASGVYDRSSVRLGEGIVRAADVLTVAGQACQRYARALGDAQRLSLVATTWADRLAREHDDLVADWRALSDRRATQAASVPSPVQLGQLFAAQSDDVAESRRLLARGAALEADVRRARAMAADAAHRATLATDALVRVLDELAGFTTARQQAAAEAQRRSALGLAPQPEDGSVGSRLGGAASGLWSGLAAPTDLVLGLIGAHGDLPGHWRDLGAGVRDGVQHPLRVGGELVDVRDIRDGAWGHWTGTIVPSVLFAAGTDGIGTAAEASRAADVLAIAERVAARLREVQDADVATQTQVLLDALGGRGRSRLVPFGGLAWHEAAGGHALLRHVDMSRADLVRRLRDEPVSAASTFLDRVVAEAAVSDVLRRNGAAVARWLASGRAERAFYADLRRPVGLILHRPGRGAAGRYAGSVPSLASAVPVEATTVKVVLRQDPASPLGYFVFTAFPVR